MRNLLIVMLLLFITACGAKKGEQTRRSVRAVHPQATQGESVKRLSGVVKEAREKSPGFQNGGAIERGYAKEGD